MASGPHHVELVDGRVVDDVPQSHHVGVLELPHDGDLAQRIVEGGLVPAGGARGVASVWLVVGCRVAGGWLARGWRAVVVALQLSRPGEVR